MKTIKKAQNGAKTADSTAYFKKKAQEAYGAAAMNMTRNPESMFKLAKEYGDSSARQSKKGKPGYDKNGYPIKKKKAKSGATVSKAKDGKWIQKATASIKRRGTKGVCTGAKFGGPTCKPGSKRYNLAKTFKSIAKKKK